MAKPSNMGSTCHYCRREFPFEAITRDHVIPKARGGRTNWRNLVPSCLKCNQRKASSPPTCGCPVCLVAYAYHHDLIESVRLQSPKWADALTDLLGPQLTATVYAPYSDPIDLGELTPRAVCI